MINDVAARLDGADAPAGMKIWPMIETPAALYNVREIAAPPPRLPCS